MKKLIITLLLLPIAVGAMADLLPIRDPQVQKPVETPDSKYMAGAVPEKDGIVTFTRSFRVANKSQAEIYAVINNYVKGLVAAARQDLRTRIISDDPAQGEVVAKAEEIMTFKKKFLNWDHTYFRYLISAKCEGQRVTMTITQISYYYNFDQEGSGGEEYRAEEWISDKVAINKKGTKLYPRSGKFRRKTIDRVDEIFAGAKAAFSGEEEVIIKRVKQSNVIDE